MFAGQDGESVIRHAGFVADAPFEIVQPTRPGIPLLIAVPHAGRSYSSGLLASMRQPEETRLRLEDRLVDVLARKVAARCGATLLLAHAPRALIDLNRSPDDVDWEMVEGACRQSAARYAAGHRARSGLGLVPRRLAGIGELWKGRVTAQELGRRITHVHQPYHAALARLLEGLRDCWGAALLLDLHSMPPLGPKFGDQRAADFVIGDRFGASCAARLVALAQGTLEHAGWRVALNHPYAGGYVLDRHAAPQRQVHAMQLEVCRAVYLDQDLRLPGRGMDRVAKAIATMAEELGRELIGPAAPLVQAAE